MKAKCSSLFYLLFISTLLITSVAAEVELKGSEIGYVKELDGMAVLNGVLYLVDSDSELIRSYDGSTWSDIGTIGGAWTITDYNNTLYVGTYHDTEATLYRWDGGTTWTSVGTIVGTYANVDFLEVYNGDIYAGVNVQGYGQVYKYDGNVTWAQIKSQAQFLRGMVSGDKLYAAWADNQALDTGMTYSYDGASWAEMSTDSQYHSILHWNGGELYALDIVIDPDTYESEGFFYRWDDVEWTLIDTMLEEELGGTQLLNYSGDIYTSPADDGVNMFVMRWDDGWEKISISETLYGHADSAIEYDGEIYYVCSFTQPGTIYAYLPMPENTVPTKPVIVDIGEVDTNNSTVDDLTPRGNGTGSTDEDLDTLYYAWYTVEHGGDLGTPDFNTTFSETVDVASLGNLVNATEYDTILVVTDLIDSNQSDVFNFTVQVLEVENAVPTIPVIDDIEGETSSFVTIGTLTPSGNGTGSTDDDLDPLYYAWYTVETGGDFGTPSYNTSFSETVDVASLGNLVNATTYDTMLVVTDLMDYNYSYIFTYTIQVLQVIDEEEEEDEVPSGGSPGGGSSTSTTEETTDANVTTTTATTNPKAKPSTLENMALVGGVIAGVAGISLILFLLWRKKKKKPRRLNARPKSPKTKRKSPSRRKPKPKRKL